MPTILSAYRSSEMKAVSTQTDALDQPPDSDNPSLTYVAYLYAKQKLEEQQLKIDELETNLARCAASREIILKRNTDLAQQVTKDTMVINALTQYLALIETTIYERSVHAGDGIFITMGGPFTAMDKRLKELWQYSRATGTYTQQLLYHIRTNLATWVCSRRKQELNDMYEAVVCHEKSNRRPGQTLQFMDEFKRTL